MSNCLNDIKYVCGVHIQSTRNPRLMFIYDDEDTVLSALLETNQYFDMHFLTIGTEKISEEIIYVNNKIYISNIADTVEDAHQDKALNAPCDIVYFDSTVGDIKNLTLLDHTIGSNTLLIVKHNKVKLPKFVNSFAISASSILGNFETDKELYTVMLVS